MRLISLNLNYRKWLAAISLMLLINPGVSIISIMPATRSSCVCTRKLKTICRLKFNNVDSAASIQTLSLSLHSSPPFTIMEARISGIESSIVVSHLFVMTARLMGLLNIRLLLIDERHEGKATWSFFFFSRVKIFDASSNDQLLNFRSEKILEDTSYARIST